MKHFITEDMVEIFSNKKQERDMAFPVIANSFHGNFAIYKIIDEVCSYLFDKTNFVPTVDNHITYLVTGKYPTNYKNIVGTAYWGEKNYDKNLARIRLYHKVRNMNKKFVNDIYNYLIHGENSLFSRAKDSYVKTFFMDKPSNKVKYIRNRFFNNIKFEVDKDKKIVVAYFGDTKKQSRNCFALMALHVVYASFLRQLKPIYTEEAFVNEDFLNRKFVGVAKYNKDKETEPFSVEKGKELAKADLVKRYMIFEKKVAIDNFNHLLMNVEQVQRQYNKFNK